MNKDKIKILKFYKYENNTYTLVKKSENNNTNNNHNTGKSNSTNKITNLTTNAITNSNTNNSNTVWMNLNEINKYPNFISNNDNIPFLNEIESEYDNMKNENKSLHDQINHLKNIKER